MGELVEVGWEGAGERFGSEVDCGDSFGIVAVDAFPLAGVGV